MLDAYLKVTGNTTVLDRALPLASAEMEWWKVNRTIDVTSPFTNTSYRVAHYAVINSAPRPEGYVEDIDVALGAQPPLNATQRADIYAELASGAESGWDYSSRWCKEPLGNATDNSVPLRTLNIRQIIPVDLNALLAGDHALVSALSLSMKACLTYTAGQIMGALAQLRRRRVRQVQILVETRLPP